MITTKYKASRVASEVTGLLKALHLRIERLLRLQQDNASSSECSRTAAPHVYPHGSVAQVIAMLDVAIGNEYTARTRRQETLASLCAERERVAAESQSKVEQVIELKNAKKEADEEKEDIISKHFDLLAKYGALEAEMAAARLQFRHDNEKLTTEFSERFSSLTLEKKGLSEDLESTKLQLKSIEAAHVVEIDKWKSKVSEQCKLLEGSEKQIDCYRERSETLRSELVMSKLIAGKNAASHAVELKAERLKTAALLDKLEATRRQEAQQNATYEARLRTQHTTVQDLRNDVAYADRIAAEQKDFYAAQLRKKQQKITDLRERIQTICDDEAAQRIDLETQVQTLQARVQYLTREARNTAVQ